MKKILLTLVISLIALIGYSQIQVNETVWTYPVGTDSTSYSSCYLRLRNTPVNDSVYAVGVYPYINKATWQADSLNTTRFQEIIERKWVTKPASDTNTVMRFCQEKIKAIELSKNPTWNASNIILE